MPASIKSVLEKAGIGGERIGAVGLTGQLHGMVLLEFWRSAEQEQQHSKDQEVKDRTDQIEKDHVITDKDSVPADF